MTGRLTPVLAIAVASLLASPLLSSSNAVEAQDPYRVLIVDFFAEDAQDKGFGQRAANELRDLVGDVPGYATIPRGEIQTEVRKYPDQLKLDAMDCIKTRQLGSLMGARLAFCVSYVSEGESRSVKAVEVWDLWDQQSFTIPAFAKARNQQADAAKQIFDGFDVFIKQVQFTNYCQQYASSQSWEDALRNCDQALGLNPNAMATVALRADILRNMNRNAEALQAIDRVIEADPLNDKALQMGGWLATQLQETAKGRGYYRRYLELNPGDAAVRRTIAYEIYEAGDPEGAMQFIEEGLGGATEDVDLLLAYGSYAFQAADKNSRAAATDNAGADVPPSVAELYRKAAGAYEKVFQIQGAQMEVGYLRNTVAAYLQLKQNDEAIRMAERFLAAHAQDVALLSHYSSALEKAARIDDALGALKRIEAVDPNFQNLYPRQALLLLNANRVDEAIPMLKEAVAKGFEANQAAQMLLAEATNKGMQPQGREDWPYAIRMLEAAKQFPVTPEKMQEFDFYLGYSLYQRGVSLQPANDQPPTAAQARQALPFFQRSKQFLEASRPWAQRTNRGANLNQIIDAANQYIEIQDAVIKRGGN